MRPSRLITPITKMSCTALAIFTILLTLGTYSGATSSTTFWTSETPDFQPYGVFHLGIDDYFRIDHPHDPSFYTDFTAPTVGILPFQKIQMEVGVDYFGNAPHPWYGNAKVGSPEGSFRKWQPALEVGVFGVGAKYHQSAGQSRMDFDVLYGVIGKTIPKLGRFSIGPYLGNHAALLNGNGKPDNVGFMTGLDHGFLPSKDKEFNRVVFAMDYASGHNAIGAAGGGFYYYFTKDISLLVGPTFFNDKAINGRWKLSTQLDINLPKLFGKRAK